MLVLVSIFSIRPVTSFFKGLFARKIALLWPFAEDVEVFYSGKTVCKEPKIFFEDGMQGRHLFEAG